MNYFINAARKINTWNSELFHIGEVFNLIGRLVGPLGYGHLIELEEKGGEI